MNFRITTNMVMNSYRYNLQNSTKKLTEARDMVMTGRYFNSYAEDPAGATLSFRLRRSYLQTCSYLANTKDVYSKFNTGWQNLAGVVEELSDRTARTASIRGNNGPSGESRRALAIDLRETAESLIHSMNQKLGDHFIFAGNDALNAPFTWSEDGKILYYRGVNVNAGGVKKPVFPDEEPEWGEKYTEDDLKADIQTAKTIADAQDRIDKAKKDIDFDKQQIADTEKAIADADEVADAGNIQTWKDFINALRDRIAQNEAAIEAAEAEIETEEENNPLPEWWDEFTVEGDWEETEAAIKEARVERPIDMPTKAANNYEQLWIDYYNGGLDPATQKPGWVQEIENGSQKGKGFVLDEYGTPDVDAITEARRGKLRAIDQAWIEYYQNLAEYNKDQEEYAKLKAMSGEEMYIDLGMGAEEKAPNIPVKGTYFNSALCGIDFLSFGVDEDGDPKNLALIMKELADVFDTWDEDVQGYNPALAKDTAEGLSRDELEEKAFRLMDKLKAAQEHTTEMWVEMDAQSVYLQTSESRLSMQATQLNIQFVELEEVDPAEAISMFAYQNYCYSAALKIGNQLLSQSLIDYMR